MIILGVNDDPAFADPAVRNLPAQRSDVHLRGDYFRKYGFLAPVGIHFWADIVWHVLWGLV